MRRLPSIPEDKLTDSQLAVLRAIQSGPRGKIPMTGPFGVWLREACEPSGCTGYRCLA